jgi:2'-5' RNA ligase
MGGSSTNYSALSALLGAGREEATAALIALRDVLTDAAGVRREMRAAKPHVTVARPRRRATPEDREAGLAWASALELGGVRARLDRIALFTWSERRLERLFRVVAERRLT